MIPSVSMAKTNRNDRYYSVAELAARAERFGQYEQASKLWRKAIKLARKEINACWSAHRAELCNNIIRNGWS